MSNEEAHRILVEGRLSVVTKSDNAVAARVRDVDAVYRLGGAGGLWECDCPSDGWCAHLLALELVVVRRPALDPPTRGQSKPGDLTARIVEGCTCDIDFNELGRGFDTVASVDELGEVVLERGWWIDPHCPLHGEEART